MSDTLYLDTARLGLMSPGAQRLQNAFARLAGDPHGLLYFDEFLRSGRGTPRVTREDQFKGFAGWRGVDGLAESVRRLTGANKKAQPLFTSRSSTLIELGAKHLASKCRRVLTADLLWPPYRRRLVQTCRRSGATVVVAQLRNAALHGEMSADGLGEMVCDAYQQHGCDGLAIPLIDHRGVTLPVGKITRRLAVKGCPPRFSVVDASQALGHLPLSIDPPKCDLLVAGAHKWLGGYHPLGIGVVSSPARQLATAPRVDDPLLQLTQEASGCSPVRHGETAAILPLLTAAGAIADLDSFTVQRRLGLQLSNRRVLVGVLEQAGWRSIRRGVEHHGILLARPTSTQTIREGRAVRRLLAKHGVIATTYNNGIVRFSLPHKPFADSDLDLIGSALHATAVSGVRTGAYERARFRVST